MANKLSILVLLLYNIQHDPKDIMQYRYFNMIYEHQ